MPHWYSPTPSLASFRYMLQHWALLLKPDYLSDFYHRGVPTHLWPLLGLCSYADVSVGKQSHFSFTRLEFMYRSFSLLTLNPSILINSILFFHIHTLDPDPWLFFSVYSLPLHLASYHVRCSSKECIRAQLNWLPCPQHSLWGEASFGTSGVPPFLLCIQRPEGGGQRLEV